MVRVVGTVSQTPAELSGGPFVIMPLLRLPGPAGAPAPNLLLATGSAIDHTRLTAVADRVIPGSVTTFRTGVLASLASSPLQHGAGLLITLTIATAAALGLPAVIIGVLALAALAAEARSLRRRDVSGVLRAH